MDFIQNKNIVFSKLDGEVCIFHPDNGEYLTLNETGTFIWELLDDRKSEESILSSVLNTFDGQKDAIKVEINEFLERSTKLNIIKVCSE